MVLNYETVSTFQELFSASKLSVIAPDTSISFPSEDVNADEWITHLKTSNVDRKLAFFDEKLEYYLTVLLKDDESSQHPPPQLLAFLSHLQVSFDAAYISSVVPSSEHFPPPNTPGLPSPVTSPPRNQSLQAQSNKFRHLPRIFPPTTPHPIPSAAESDKRYVWSEGTPLSAGVWGESPFENFQLLRSKTKNSWVAIYKFVINVSFVRMNFADPLLCLTVSTTLRDKPAPFTGPRKRLAELIDAAGGPASVSITPITPWRKKDDKQVYEETEDDVDSELVGFEEVNLLGGLYSAPTFKSEKIALPSTRLGPVTRHETFSLPPLRTITASPSSSPTQIPKATIQTLRKSFRKTLKTVSGFRVRMRTVFVPYVLFPVAHMNTKKDHQISGAFETNSDSEDEGTKWDRERKEAGNDESTVVLCVEVENSGESGMGFTVEGIDVHISGEGAKTTLIEWGFSHNQTTSVFPLRIGRMEQYNLLYAVTFLDAPDKDEFGNSTRKQVEMQRAVTIEINGKPHNVQDADGGITPYPTRTFSSRWNCILDLSANINKELVGVPDEGGDKEALPTPASPFPGAGPSTIRPRTVSLLQDGEKSFAGSKRLTLGSISPVHGTTIRVPMNYRSTTSMLNPAFQKERESLQTPISSTGMYTPPSVMFQSTYPRAATTYGSRTTSPLPLGPTFDEEVFQPLPPPTPAYPAFPNVPAGAVYSQAPVTSTQSSVGPSVEIRRGLNNRVVGGINAMGEDEERREGGESIVVSVGLLIEESCYHGKEKSGGSEEMIYPNDKFTLDIFVLNQSSWIRRLEVSYPDGRSLRKKMGESGKHREQLGIMPLENRIRVGPLRPLTCQSVRMSFLALAPGVHPVDTLTVTDIETGYAVNLRSVMDIVVHEPPDPDA